MSSSTLQAPPPGGITGNQPRRWRVRRQATSLVAQGEPWLWLASGALAIALAMIVGLLALILVRGTATFWPRPLVRIERVGAAPILGEVNAEEDARREPEHHRAGADAADSGVTGAAASAPSTSPPANHSTAPVERRRSMRTGNFDLTGKHYEWVFDSEVARESRPEWALSIERLGWGRFHGEPVALLLDGKPVAEQPAEILRAFELEHERVLERVERKHKLERDEIGAVNRAIEELRLTQVREAAAQSESAPRPHATVGGTAADELAREHLASLERRYEELMQRSGALDAENARHALRMLAPTGVTADIALTEIVRIVPANRLSWFAALRVYLSRWWEYLSEVPRGSDGEGGVFPAIFGTVVMTLLMSIAVVPFGVLAALYLREYAKAGPLLSLLRISVNNLAGVPSIVFGVFGLGFFCAIIGTSIDGLLFAERLPNPTYGKGGLLWAALTLALLTLPVVIVATEEAIAAVPNSMREGSFACGATKWQTIRRIVLPRALPGIMTGMILAIARGAGEVAPLMLVGAVKIAPQLAIDSTAPYVHPERSFLHLGYQIFDLGFQTQNSEAAKPLVFTTTLILISIVVALNLSAIWIRARLRRRFVANPF